MDIKLTNNKTITLNSQQEYSLNHIKEWVESGDQFYVLSGYAGTGKTSICGEALRNFKGITGITTPTHTATEIISDVTGIQGCTVHSLLGLRPNTDIDDFDVNNPFFDQQAEARMAYIRLLIVDEASMLNDIVDGKPNRGLYTMIKNEAKRYGTKVIFMGDNAQLPPVKEKLSAVFIDPEIRWRSELTIVERQQGSNPLMKIYDKIRSDLFSKVVPYDYIDNINDFGEGVQYIEDRKEFIEITSKEFNFDKPMKFKILAWKNEIVGKINIAIRKKIYGNDVATILKGEILVGYNSITEGMGAYVIKNSRNYSVKEVWVQDRDEDNEYKGWNVTIQDVRTKGERTVFVLDQSDTESMKIFISNIKKLLNDAKQFRGHYWNKYYNYKNEILLMKDVYEDRVKLVKKDIDYGYCITVHKSQGSTYTNVGVIESDISSNPNVVEMNKLRYVALTRPTTKAIICY